MSVAVNKGESLGCSKPRLVFIHREKGFLTDLNSLEFEIWDLSPSVNSPTKTQSRVTVDVSNDCPTGEKLSKGRYAANWSVPADANLGTHEIRWFYKTSSGDDEVEVREPFEVLHDDLFAPTWHGLTTTKRMIDDNVARMPDSPTASEMRTAQRRIHNVTRKVVERTGRHFNPRYATHYLSVGDRPSTSVRVEPPIIGIETVHLLQRGDDVADKVQVENEDLLVYNRHLDGLESPDDRRDSRIEAMILLPGRPQLWVERERRAAEFPKGSQNVQVVGVFGYRDYDENSPFGRMPDGIEAAVLIAVANGLTPESDVKKFDQLIAPYARPPELGAV